MKGNDLFTAEEMDKIIKEMESDEKNKKKMKKKKDEKVCIQHIPSFLVGVPGYKIVDKKQCHICIREKNYK